MGTLAAARPTPPQQLSRPEWHGHQERSDADGRADKLQQFFEGINLLASEFVGFATAGRGRQNGGEPRHHVFDIDGLKPGLSAADQRQRRQPSRQRGKAVEEVIVWAKDQAGPDDRCVGERGVHCRFAGRFGSVRQRRCRAAGSKRRHVNELPRTQAPGGGRHPASPGFMDGGEGLPLRLRENADQIDDRVGPLDRRLDSRIIENVGRDVFDSAQPRRLGRGERMARRDPYGGSRHGEMLDEMASDKSRPAEDCDLLHRCRHAPETGAVYWASGVTDRAMQPLLARFLYDFDIYILSVRRSVHNRVCVKTLTGDFVEQFYAL